MCFVFLVRVHFFVDILMCVRCKLEISTRDLNFFNQVKNCGSFYKKRRRHRTSITREKTEKKEILEMEVEEPKRSVKDEKRVECNSAEDEGGEAGKVNLSLRKSLGSWYSVESMFSCRNYKIGSMKPVQENNNSKPSSPSQRDSSITKQEDKIESAKAEMGEVREENERLKTTLARIVKEYQSLQLQFYSIVQQEQAKKSSETTTTSTDQGIEESELVSLSLGTTASGQKKEEKIVASSSKSKEEEQLTEGLTLGLDCKFEASTSGAYETPSNPSPENSFEEPKEEEVGEAWPPSKILKTLRSGDDEVSQQTSVKKARVSVRARCDTPTMNDGCQWRKYGQKIAKGNPCPRAYYRCTVAPGCPVRKQVQRCADDMSILITTYEGNHNHPLPVSATAMASTTAAAASMLMSGSSTSQQTFGGFGTNTTSANLHGLNFSISDNSRSRQFYLPNPSISPSASYPTITLDLTSPPTSLSQPSQFNRFSSSFSSAPRSYYSSTSFNFSSSDSSTVPTSWGNGYLSYGSQAYKPNQIGPLNLGKQSQEQFYQSYLQKNNPVPPQQSSLTDSIAAATKAITSDPSFRSALAAAITSIVGNGGVHGNQAGVENVGQNLKWVEPIQAIPPYSSSSNGNCAPSYMNRSASSNHQQGNLIFLSSSLPFSSKSTSAPSSVDNREHIN